MLKYTIPKGIKNIQLPLETKNNDLSSNSFDYDVKKTPIVNFEKNGYVNQEDFSINLYFFINNRYDLTLDTLFDFDKDINKNVFKKSNLVLEFYEQGETLTWLGSEVLPLTNGEFKPARVEEVAIPIKDGFRIERQNKPQTVAPKFKITKESIFLSELYFYRDFNQFKDIVDGEGRIYVRAILQNAKDGNRYYFINGNNNKRTITKDSEYSFYQELRCKRDFTYYFKENGRKITVIDFKEMVGF